MTELYAALTRFDWALCILSPEKEVPGEQPATAALRKAPDF